MGEGREREKIEDKERVDRKRVREGEEDGGMGEKRERGEKMDKVWIERE